MSYILEGLKKLEQKRKQQELSPQSISFQTQDVATPSKKHLWLGIIAAALVLNAGIMYLSFEKHPAPKNNATPEKNASHDPIPQNTKPIEREDTNSTAPSSTATAQAPSEIAPVKSATLQPQRQAIKEEVKQKQPPAESAERINKKPAPSGKIVRLNELPEEIKKVLPEFKVSAHFYSTEQKARFVRINDKILHEGETLIEGLKVEEINQNGTVFSYQGHRFLIGINQNQ